MSTPIRAVYSSGQLRLLDPVDLVEGQQIEVVILTERERVRAALGDLLAKFPHADDEEDIDEEALMREIEEGFKGTPPLSDDIIAERREGP